jgi:hypothetical protein
MGLRLVGSSSKSVNTGISYSTDTTPEPNPHNWKILEIYVYKNSHILVVEYPNCTNFEGKKVLIIKGKFQEKKVLDPHFSEDFPELIARFRPTNEGIKMAMDFANLLEK